MNVLHIDSSALGASSVSREITAAVVKSLTGGGQGVQVTYRDVAASPLAHLDGALLSVMRPAPGATPVDMDAPHNAALRAEAAMTETVLNEFLSADVVVLGAPMYNFGIPSSLKAWIDRLAQAGKTFRYTATGPEGLCKGKRLVLVSARGGMYAGTAYESAMDHQEAYVKAVMGFMGVTDVTIVRAEGVAMGPEARAKAIDAALATSAQISAVAA
ncbi:MAG: FMN-dependent NADH-azoreductase [Rhizobacter sp.]|nr:FMN-dependent NADH-azoreductase [Rhizobacter sp.]